MNLRPEPAARRPAYPRTDRESVHNLDQDPAVVQRAAEARVLDRAYPLAKQLAEILELEPVGSLALDAKRLRQRIGSALAERAAAEEVAP